MPASNKHLPLKHLLKREEAYQKPEHDLTATKVKCICNKYANKEAMKIASSSGIRENIKHSSSYSLLFG